MKDKHTFRFALTVLTTHDPAGVMERGSAPIVWTADAGRDGGAGPLGGHTSVHLVGQASEQDDAVLHEMRDLAPFSIERRDRLRARIAADAAYAYDAVEMGRRRERLLSDRWRGRSSWPWIGGRR